MSLPKSQVATSIGTAPDISLCFRAFGQFICSKGFLALLSYVTLNACSNVSLEIK